MRMHLDCVPCILRQALDANKFATDDEGEQAQILREVIEVLGKSDFDEAPMFLSPKIQKAVREVAGVDDP